MALAVGVSNPNHPSITNIPASVKPSPDGVIGTVVSSEAASPTTKAPATDTGAPTAAATVYNVAPSIIQPTME